MRTTIPAVLDLDKALKSFREAVVSVMKIGEVSHWDGNELRQREQQIRQASLVLAGHCIALLIHTLADDCQAHQEAAKRTQGMRDSGAQGMGRQPIGVMTIGNVLLKLRLPYLQGPGQDSQDRQARVSQ